MRDDRGLLPLTTRNITAVVVTDLDEGNPLVDAVRELQPNQLYIINSTTPEQEIDGELIVLLLALRPKSGAGRIAMPAAARRLAERRTIAVSFGSPYVLRDFGTAVCAYGIQPVLQLAAIRAIRGEAPMSGRLPVTL